MNIESSLTSKPKALSPKVTTTDIPTTNGNMDKVISGNVIEMDSDIDAKEKSKKEMEKKPVLSDEGDGSEVLEPSPKPFGRPSLKDIMRIGTYEGEMVTVEPKNTGIEGPGFGFAMKENLDSSNADVSVGEMTVNKEDEEVLHNTLQGFGDEANLKVKLLGFGDGTEKLLYPLIDRQSMKLFDIIQELEFGEIRAITNLIHAHSEPAVPIDRKMLPRKTGSQITLKVLRLPTAELPEINEDNEGKVLHTLKKPLELGWKREIHLQPKQGPGDVVYFSPDGLTINSLRMLDNYLKENPSQDLSLEDFSFVAQPIGMKDVKKELIVIPKRTRKRKKVTPNATKRAINVKPVKPVKPTVVKPTLQSSRRTIQPPKRYSTGATSLQPEKKSKVSAKTDQQTAMTMGMLPPKYQKAANKKNLEPIGAIGESPVTKRRGRPPKVHPIVPVRIAPRPVIHSMMEEEEEGDGLFQISALQYSNSLLTSFEEVLKYAHALPEPLLQGPTTTFNPPPNLGFHPIQPGPKQKNKFNNMMEELLPCSIRCHGMTGEVPTLQCKRCLCLYHPECIGLPPNLNFSEFLCSNCEAKGGGNLKDGSKPKEFATPHLPSQVRRSMPEAKRRTGGPNASSRGGTFVQRQGVDSSGFQAIGQGGMSVKRLDTVQSKRPGATTGGEWKVPKQGMYPPISISAIPMKRGRGRPPRQTQMVVPPLPNKKNIKSLHAISKNSKQLKQSVPRSKNSSSIHSLPKNYVSKANTEYSKNITAVWNMKTMTPVWHGPLSIPIRGPIPEVPKLGGHGEISNSLNDSAVMKPYRYPPNLIPGYGFVPHIARKVGPPPKLSFENFGLRYLHPNAPRKPYFPPQFQTDYSRRYPQGVVTIGTKKYVVVPRGQDSQPVRDAKNKKETGAAEIEMTTLVDIANCDQILDQVFLYLSVRDLMSASRVNRTWNRIATQRKLWVAVRMKNTHVADADGFALFLEKVQAQIIDLRKMAISPRTDLSYLFEALTSVTSIIQLVLGASSTPDHEIVQAYRRECPLVDIYIT